MAGNDANNDGDTPMSATSRTTLARLLRDVETGSGNDTLDDGGCGD